ncbi:IS3 family transposase [Bacillus thuringiensis]
MLLSVTRVAYKSYCSGKSRDFIYYYSQIRIQTKLSYLPPIEYRDR